jgi:hypothetical protein
MKFGFPITRRISSRFIVSLTAHQRPFQRRTLALNDPEASGAGRVSATVTVVVDVTVCVPQATKIGATTRMVIAQRLSFIWLQSMRLRCAPVVRQSLPPNNGFRRTQADNRERLEHGEIPAQQRGSAK